MRSRLHWQGGGAPHDGWHPEPASNREQHIHKYKNANLARQQLSNSQAPTTVMASLTKLKILTHSHCQAVRGSTIPWKYLTIANLEFAHEDKNSVCGRKAACSVNVRSQLWKPLQRPLLATFMRKPAAPKFTTLKTLLRSSTNLKKIISSEK